jgi:hypothetical protein
MGDRSFGGMYRLLLQSENNQQIRSMLAVTSNCSTLRRISHCWKLGAICSSETSVFTRATRRHIPADYDILHSEGHKPPNLTMFWALCGSNNIFFILTQCLWHVITLIANGFMSRHFWSRVPPLQCSYLVSPSYATIIAMPKIFGDECKLWIIRLHELFLLALTDSNWYQNNLISILFSSLL